MDPIDSVIIAGMIIKTTFQEWQNIKRDLQRNFPDVQIIYQKISAGKLKIIAED